MIKDMDGQYISIKNYESPYGILVLGSFKDRLCLCDWKHSPKHGQVLSRVVRLSGASPCNGGSDVIDETVRQLDGYFRGWRRVFDIPLAMYGTDFQCRVWSALMQVEYGHTMSYMQLACRVGSAAAVRAVGAAVGVNALSIIVPCHRIVGTDGGLTGYAGSLPVKRRLLDQERCQ